MKQHQIMKGFWRGISHKHIVRWLKANKNASMMYVCASTPPYYLLLVLSLFIKFRLV